MEEFSAMQLRERIAAGEMSSVEAVEGVFERIDELEPTIGAYISTRREMAMERAAEVDRRLAAGEQVGGPCPDRAPALAGDWRAPHRPLDRRCRRSLAKVGRPGGFGSALERYVRLQRARPSPVRV